MKFPGTVRLINQFGLETSTATFAFYENKNGTKHWVNQFKLDFPQKLLSYQKLLENIFTYEWFRTQYYSSYSDPLLYVYTFLKYLRVFLIYFAEDSVHDTACPSNFSFSYSLLPLPFFFKTYFVLFLLIECSDVLF